MGQALYRTYRSRNLAEIVGQEHITQALSNALKKGLISHAYLFTGPRGVGKTSIARILAHEVNQLDYSDDNAHLDIIEIDAASNRRIDEMRDLRDKVHVAPSHGKYKVYIIDEVHMLTREAFNALLKTLEEPPAHVIFILATTEVHKLPETIISRTQRYAFKPVDLAKVAGHLRDIAKKEKINIDDEALALIAAHGEGSFRDSISLLDQMRSGRQAITAADVQNVLGVAPEALVAQLLQAVQTHNAAACMQLLGQCRAQGVNPAQIAKQLSGKVRDALVNGQPLLPHDQTMSLLTKLLNVPAAHAPAELLQIIMLDAALSDAPVGTPVAPPPASTKPAPPAPAPKPTTKPAPKVAKPKVSAKEESAATAPTTEPEQTTVVPASGEALDANTWLKVLGEIRKKYNTLYGILKTAGASFAPGVVTLEVGFAFHQKRLNEARNKQILTDTIKTVSGLDMAIECVVGTPKKPVPSPEAGDEIVHGVTSTQAAAAKEEADYYIAQAEKESTKPLDTVNDVFGGGELLGA